MSRVMTVYCRRGSVRTHYASLENWKRRRQDKKTELYWEHNPPTNSWQEYQKEWNFKETDYNSEPSNNGLDLSNPAFAFDKKLIKFIKHKSCIIVNSQCMRIR